MPNKVLYVFFIVGACMGALVTTLNSSFVWYTNSLIKPCEDGFLPKGLAKKNKYGVPWPLMIIFYLFGLIPAAIGMDLMVLSKMAIGLTILGTCIPMAGILNLPNKYEKEWSESKYAARYPKWRRICMVILTYVILSSQVYSLFVGNPLWSNVIIIAYMIVVIAGIAIRRYRINHAG